MIMNRFITTALVLSLFSLLPTVAQSVNAATLSASAVSLPENSKESRKHKDKNWEQIKSAQIAFFTASVGLTPEEAKLFWPVFDKFHDECREAHKKTRSLQKKIKELSDKGGWQEIEMKKLLIEFQDSFKKEGEIGRLYLDEFLKILSVEKVAKLYVAEEEFRMKMIKMWQKPPVEDPERDD